MAATAVGSSSSDEQLKHLKEEIEHLNERLLTADREKAQAGALGLQLLNEKDHLETQLEIIQKECEVTKADLIKTKKVLDQFREQNRVVTATELDHEQSLLEDSAKLEAHYIEKIGTLESECKLMHEKMNQYKSEVERLQNEHTDNFEKLNILEAERKNLRDELKELKNREQLLLNDNNELEEENVTLQKQVSNLKSAQVEFEAMKMEISRLLEEILLLQTATDEANKLRSVAEKQEQEALQSAQQEREQRIALRKEYEKLRNDEHLSNLNSLFLGIKEANNECDQSTLKQLESSLISDGPIESHHFGISRSTKGSDLFSEIHDGLADKVGALETEKEELNGRLEVMRKSVPQLVAPLFQKLDISGNFDNVDMPRLKEYMELALDKLEEQLKPSRADKNAEKKAEQLRADLRQAVLFAGQQNAKLCVAQDRMVALSAQLYQFYSEIADGRESGESRAQVATIMQHLRKIAEENFEKDSATGRSTNTPPTDEVVEESNGVDFDRDARSPRIPSLNLSRSIISSRFLKEMGNKIGASTNLEGILNESDLRDKLVQDEDDLKKVSDSLYDLLRLVKSAAEMRVQSKMAMEDKDKADMYQMVTKLKSLLAVKREQVSSLRTVLRSNKTTTESALQCLRDKYESEKKLKDESMEALRRELKQFKEDAATFASHRAMFTARCEELQGQVESIQGNLKKSEDEKKTLNQLLRMAINQKLVATQRVEELEFNREHSKLNPQLVALNKRPMRSTTGGGQQLPIGGQHRTGETTKTVRYPVGGGGSAGGAGSGSTNGHGSNMSSKNSK